MASQRDAATDDAAVCIGLIVITLICGFVAVALVG
jgi:hypothetical protein